MQTTENNYKLFELFGGALKINLPGTFRSMEDLVPIPDTQEVF
jgi:hypothetical protein